MTGGFHGNFALYILLYAALLLLATVAHVEWVRGIARLIWRSKRSTPLRLTLIVLAFATPVIGFYAVMLLRKVYRPQLPSEARKWAFVMPAFGLTAILLCTGDAELRYATEWRSRGHAFGFIPGLFALYVVMLLVIHMGASVFGLSRNGILATRVHLVSGTVLLATAVLTR